MTGKKIRASAGIASRIHLAQKLQTPWKSSAHLNSPENQYDMPRFSIAFIAFCFVGAGLAAQQDAELTNERYQVSFDGRGMKALVCPQDSFKANFIGERMSFGEPRIAYILSRGDTLVMDSLARKRDFDPAGKRVVFTDFSGELPFTLTQEYRLADESLEYTLTLESGSQEPVIIGDLAVPVPWAPPLGREQVQIFERGFTKHHFIAGDGSYLYFSKHSGHPPFLLITTQPGTHLEYFNQAMRMGYKMYIHSCVSGNAEKRGTWRQEHTMRKLGREGGPEDSFTYGLKFHWVDSYDEMREVLYKEGLFDIRVVPGMSLPSNLKAKFSLHTLNHIDSITAEYPEQTTLTYLGEPEEDHHVYEVSFARLGENMLTIHCNGKEKTCLEFFSTEPLETLFKKRADFITKHQQHRDTSKWYNGLYSVYDMRNAVLRGPGNTDGFDGWWGYVLACDDPALCKAPYVAAKNVFYPDPDEIGSVEYYLEHFVWGGLQRTDKEDPYPYGIHGTPNWKVARDTAARREVEGTRNLDKMKIWRSYDYPHIIMLYYHMYQVAKFYPDLVHYLDAGGYLERAYQTARAYWQYPYEVLPWYQTYKIGCYNELVILDLMRDLEREGYPEKADHLRKEWEKKAKYFIYDDDYPYGSEYSVDRTAFESSYALAKYGVLTEMKPDSNLWWDKNLEKWWSHPVVSRQKAREFMERQLYAGLCVRGWLEPKYFLLGADFAWSSDSHCMSYMACMGGWAILDYGIYFSEVPWDWLQLGYASYLSSWSLMNTGTEESNYGYWYPGKENDGATGWAFMSLKYGRAWIRQNVPRGAWHYDGEIDLGFGAATRTAISLIAEDPLFGWIAYGGRLEDAGDAFKMVPLDGLRSRFGFVAGSGRFTMILEKDGFAAGGNIVLSKDLGKISCRIENRSGTVHRTLLRMYLSEPEKVMLDGKILDVHKTGHGYEVYLPVSGTGHDLEIQLKPLISCAS